MNILMMTLLYPEDMINEVTQNSKDGLQNQINNYQRAFIEGIDATLKDGESLSILNALPVGVYPKHYKKLVIKKRMHGSRIQEIGCINLPWVKQKGRKHRATRALLEWLGKSSENRTVLLYTLYLPFMQAIAAAKQKYPDLKASIIVTDLPNELGLSSGRSGILKGIEQAIGERQMALAGAFDSYVLLTKPMAEALHIQNKRHVIIEGLILPDDQIIVNGNRGEQSRKSVLYAGTLNKELGIPALLEAFKSMPEYDLWLCGRGDMDEGIKKIANAHPNIHYYGFVSQKEALQLQANATLLINPRTPEGAFTRYSFPSKTLEYLRSGKPVICYQLEGIPSDYDAYLFYVKEASAEGIALTVREVIALPQSELLKRGVDGRNYVLNAKNPSVQCARMLDMLRQMHRD